MADTQIRNNVEGPSWFARNKKKLFPFALVAFGLVTVFQVFSGGSVKPKAAADRIPQAVPMGGPATAQSAQDFKGFLDQQQKIADQKKADANQALDEAHRVADSQRALNDAGQPQGNVPNQNTRNLGGGGGGSAPAPAPDGGFLLVSADSNSGTPVGTRQQEDIQKTIDQDKALLKQSMEREQELESQLRNPQPPTGVTTTNPTPNSEEKPEEKKDEEGWNIPPGPRYVVLEGRTIPCMLMNRIEGEYAGPVKCITTEDFYANDKQHMVLPAGSFVIGDAAAVNSQQQKRIRAGFHRMEIENEDHTWYTINLDHFIGLDQTGATAIPGKVNTHLLSALLWSLPIGGVSGLTMSSTNLGYGMGGMDAYRMGVAESTGQTANQVLQRKTQVFPTITVKEGTRIPIWVAKDIQLPEYHRTRN